MAILQNKFIREDGSVIGSSVIISCKYTSEVNSQTNLTVGDTTAAEVDVEIRNLASAITAGEELTYYQIEDGGENLIGVFYAEAPTIATKTSVRFKAYDGKAKLAVDFSEWLNNHQDDFPMTMRSLVNAACEVAGVALASDSFQFEDLSIPAFYADGVTSRQIVSWAAQIAGCFVACKTSGEIFFDWYKNSDVLISGKPTSNASDYSLSISNGDLILNSSGEMPQYSIDGNGNLVLEYSGAEPPVYINDSGHLVMAEEVSLRYVLDGLSKSSYTTDLIKRVQFKQSADDVGVIYPADADGNVFSISQNGIAALLDSDTLRNIAQYLYNKLQTVTYTPLTVKLPKRTANIKAGDIISVTDGNGDTVSTYVMKVYLDAGGTTITSTGDQNYAGKAAVSSEKYKNIPGRVLEIEKSVEGLRIENKDTAGKIASISMDVEAIATSVSNAEGDITKLQQTAGQVSVVTTSSAGTLATTINNDGTWKSEYTNANGAVVSGINFDFTKKQFVFNGQITANSGVIAGWNITTGKLYAGGVIDDVDTGLPGVAIATPKSTSVYVLAAGGKDHTSYSPSNGWNFAVTKDGTVFCADLRISGGTININDKFKVDAEGNVTLPDTAKISWGQVTDTTGVATKTYIAGLGYQTANQVTTITKNTITTEYVNALNITAKKLAATTGTIGGWSLTAGKLYAGDGASVKTVVVQAPTADNTFVFAAGGSSHSSYSDCPFRVTKAGKLYASSAEIAGVLTSGVGSKIGGFAVDSNSLYSGEWGATAPDVFISTGTTNSYLIGGKNTSGWAIGCGGNFGVTNKGYMYCNAARIGAWDMTASYLAGTGSATGVGVKFYADKLAFVASDGTETAVTWEKLVKGAA